jgi:hypothetical protein
VSREGWACAATLIVIIIIVALGSRDGDPEVRAVDIPVSHQEAQAQERSS